MDDLLKKLNVLVKATLSDVLTGDSQRSKLPSESPAPSLSVKEAEAQLSQLRKRVDETLAFESDLQKQIAGLESDIAHWNQQADEAVQASRDADARHAVGQVQRLQQRLAIVQSDLAEHERVSRELVFHVNTLDTAVSAAKQREEAQPSRTLDEKLGMVLQEMRDKVLELRDQVASREEIAPAPPEDGPPPSTNVDDDLAKRRQRLSKPE